MSLMSMGSNIEVTSGAVRAALRWSAGPGVPEVDASALLLDADGEVSSDADFVFYNQPIHYSGSVRMAGKTPGPQASDQIDIDLTRVPPATTRVVLAASTDGGTFGQVPELQLVLIDLASGQPIVHFPMSADAETAFVSAELYRRNDTWKFRAVGQGYSAGLAGLANDFGIDTGEAEAPGTPAPAPAPPPPPPSLDLTPPPSLDLTPPPSLDLTPPPARWAPPTPEPTPPAPAPTVSLHKNEKRELAQAGPTPLQRVVFSLGWTPAEGRSEVDLDASVIAFDVAGKKLAIVWYMHTNEFSGALQHTGDNRSGGYGDVEQVLIDLGRMPPNVEALIFTINSFRGHTFTDIKQAYCAVQNQDTGEVLARFDLTDTQPSTAVLMAELRRTPAGTWTVRAIGEFHDYRTVKKLVPSASRQVMLRR